MSACNENGFFQFQERFQTEEQCYEHLNNLRWPLEMLLGVNYVTAWLMIHKIRKAMEDRDSRYMLGHVIEMDEAFFGGPFSGKRGRGAGNKSKVIVAVENRETSAGYTKMTVVAKHFKHRGDTVRLHDANDMLPWLHILIGNAKTFIRGTYHGVSHKHLQRYLNEFCYRFNRRRNESDIFDLMLAASLSTGTITFAELTQ